MLAEKRASRMLPFHDAFARTDRCGVIVLGEDDVTFGAALANSVPARSVGAVDREWPTDRSRTRSSSGIGAAGPDARDLLRASRQSGVVERRADRARSSGCS